jgi:hypothetical protein
MQNLAARSIEPAGLFQKSGIDADDQAFAG